eukprot:4205001-Ditylum_brightwellii.AAC.1
MTATMMMTPLLFLTMHQYQVRKRQHITMIANTSDKMWMETKRIMINTKITHSHQLIMLKMLQIPLKMQLIMIWRRTLQECYKTKNRRTPALSRN